MPSKYTTEYCLQNFHCMHFTHTYMCQVLYNVISIPFWESQFINLENHCTGGNNVQGPSKAV